MMECKWKVNGWKKYQFMKYKAMWSGTWQIMKTRRNRMGGG